MGGVAALVVHGGPAAVLERAAADARTPDYGQIESGGNRFEGGLGSYRSDYWRVAVDVTAARPLAGVGAGNFAAAYLERRHTPKAPLHAHTLWLGVAAGLGLPGLALLLVAAGALAFAVVRACREAPPAERAVRAAAALPAVTLAVHASADWSSAYPGLTVPAIALAAAAAAPARRREVGAGAPAPPSPAGRREVGARRQAPASPAGRREVGARRQAPASPAGPRERWVGAEDGAWAAAPERRAGAEDGAGVGAPQGRAGAEDGGWVGAPEHRAGGRGVIALASLAVVVALAFAPVYLGARWTDRALADWRERPDAAIASLHRAASIDRLDPRPPLLEGVLSLQLGRAGDARAAFLRAAGRDRSAWYPRYALGLLAARTDRTEALRWLALAARRNPRSPDVRAARTAVARGVALDPRAAQQRALSRPG
jgi:tetratricopeptide (TPR) repeat protein